MTEAIRYLHNEKNIIHRDLHLKNWVYHLENKTIKLLDFGISLNLGQNGVSKNCWVFEVCASPEIYDNLPAGYDADLWYLTCMLYTLVHPLHWLPFGDRPFLPLEGFNVLSYIFKVE
mmetsp:Transcript_67089/g.56952  ORF Transcript_67089/g.56952 Transcript_67089/m.56952 type:complete len:117 (+) Transcript_67089:469-819(+)